MLPQNVYWKLLWIQFYSVILNHGAWIDVLDDIPKIHIKVMRRCF